jgi:hypothetical protein
MLIELKIDRAAFLFLSLLRIAAFYSHITIFIARVCVVVGIIKEIFLCVFSSPFILISRSQLIDALKLSIQYIH